MSQQTNQSNTSKSKLDRLNELLSRNAKAFGLPDHRSVVHPSGANQHWLLSALKKHTSADMEEIVALLELPIKRLLKEGHVEPQPIEVSGAPTAQH